MRSMVMLCLMTWTVALAAPRAANADDYDTARNARLAILAGPATFNASDPAIAAQLSALKATAQSDWNTMETSAGRTELWPDLTFPTSVPNTLSAHMTSTYNRLKAMALAYATHGGTLEGNSSLKSAVIDGLTWMNANVYSSTTSESGNWWDWEIGTPLALNDTMVLVYPQLTAMQVSTWVAAITHFTPSPAGSGANLMWTSEVVSLSGVLMKNGTQVAKGISKAPTVMTPVTTGDGFYHDSSFIQHTTPGYAYTGGYGTGLITDLVNFTTVYLGTQWQLSAANLDKETSLLLKSFKPFVYKGEMLDDVRGREIARWSSFSHHTGRSIIAAFLHAALNTNATDAATLRSAAKYWMQQDTTYAGQTEGFDIRTILQAQAVLSDSTIVPMPEPLGFKLFSGMDRAVHLRPGWGASVAMFSSRQGDYESINNENLKGWHTGDGMLYLYDSDLSQYGNNYWPTVNNYFPQGTTVVHNTGQAAGKRSTASYVGGVPSWDGVYGAAAMQVNLPSVSLSAKKAWFFLDNQIFCLGADITSSSSSEVRTVVANRKLSAAGTNAVTSANGTSTSSPGTEPGVWYTSTPLNYLHIAGNTAASNYGLYFPTATALQSIREARTHDWAEINTNANYVSYTTDFTNNYYYSTINHGAAPTGATYAYAVLPNITASALATYAAAPEVTVLENSATAQAITDSKLGVTAALFWQAAAKTVGTGSGSITASGQAGVFVTTRAASVEVAVTDPTWANTGTVHVSLGLSAASVLDSSSRVTVTSLSPTVEMDVDVSGLRGQPALVRLNLSTPGAVIVDNSGNTGGSTASSVGSWNISSGSAGYYGNDYVHDGNTAKGTKTFTFTPNVVGSGSYDVQIWYAPAANRATNVPVTINAADGAHTVSVNQTAGGGAWMTLGTYPFDAGTSGSVMIGTAGTNGYVVADAIRMLPH